MDIVEKLASAGYLTDDQVERIGRAVVDFKKEAGSDPVFLEEAVEKLSTDWWGVGKKILTGAAVAGTTALANDAYRAIKGSIQKSRNYKDMMDANPSLSRMDSKMVQKSFNTLHKFNPEYASDPMVAGQFVQNALEMDRMDLNMVNALTSSRKAMADARRNESGGPFDLGEWASVGGSVLKPVGGGGKKDQ